MRDGLGRDHDAGLGCRRAGAAGQRGQRQRGEDAHGRDPRLPRKLRADREFPRRRWRI